MKTQSITIILILTGLFNAAVIERLLPKKRNEKENK